MQKGRILKVLDQRQLALDSAIRNRAHFFRVEFRPSLPVKVLHERRNGMRAGHVDERIPHIALVLEVDRQVEEVERECPDDYKSTALPTELSRHFVIYYTNIPEKQ